jgi:hypothetical protein
MESEDNGNTFVLCYPTEEGVYKPVIQKDGELYLLPKGIAESKVADAGVNSGSMIILDVSTIMGKLKEY